jgi:DNA-binding response OmpR family regulator
MLVEDDKSLREIYGIRMVAEGYEIVSAGDGEEALAIAVKERPDLILSDVMMPKISGFDMLDILRATPETKDVKVIMMTALSSEAQRARGEALGANRYLVKSQVGIEDVVRSVKEVLEDKEPVVAASTPANIQPAAVTNIQQPVAPQPVAQNSPSYGQPASVSNIPNETYQNNNVPPTQTPIQ